MNDKEKEINELKERLNRLETSQDPLYEKLKNDERDKLKEENKTGGWLVNIFAFILIFGLAAWLLNDDTDETSSTEKVKAVKTVKVKPSKEQIAQVLSLFKSENTLVLQSVYNEGGVYNWVVGVNAPYDTQGSWKGYASTMCNTLYEVNILSKDKPANSTIDHGVRVIDIGKFISTDGHWRKSSLGSANCKTWKVNNI